jgi:hypothetical protein
MSREAAKRNAIFNPIVRALVPDTLKSEQIGENQE